MSLALALVLQLALALALALVFGIGIGKHNTVQYSTAQHSKNTLRCRFRG